MNTNTLPSMTSPHAAPPASAPASTASPAEPGALRRLATEPLVHFVLLGLCLFGVDLAYSHFNNDARTITVPQAVRDEARTIFKSGMNREPSAADMKVLIDRWVDNEVLYREGVAQGLDRGDSSIRERVIFKSLSVTQSGLSLPKTTEAELRAWFDKNRARYDAPARFDFLEAVPDGGAADAAQQQLLVDALNGKTKSDLGSSLRVFKERPRGNLVSSYGEAFTKTLETSPPGGPWQLVTSALGQHVVRLEAIKPAVPARFEDISNAVRKDWQEQTLSQMTTNAVREMGKKYKLRQQGDGA